MGEQEKVSKWIIEGCALMTPRQWRVLGYLGEGISREDIASKLKVSIWTVRDDIEALKSWYNVDSSMQLRIIGAALKEIAA